MVAAAATATLFWCCCSEEDLREDLLEGAPRFLFCTASSTLLDSNLFCWDDGTLKSYCLTVPSSETDQKREGSSGWTWISLILPRWQLKWVVCTSAISELPLLSSSSSSSSLARSMNWPWGRRFVPLPGTQCALSRACVGLGEDAPRFWELENGCASIVCNSTVWSIAPVASFDEPLCGINCSPNIFAWCPVGMTMDWESLKKGKGHRRMSVSSPVEAKMSPASFQAKRFTQPEWPARGSSGNILLTIDSFQHKARSCEEEHGEQYEITMQFIN